MLKPTQLIMVIVVLSLLLLEVGFSSAQCQTDSRNRSAQGEPISKEGLLNGLRELKPGDSQAGLISLIRARGVSFELTEEIRRELRKSGATPKLIEAVRANYPPRAPVDPITDQREEEAAWEQIKNSYREEDYIDFLIKYPNGKFTDQAKTRLKDLRDEAAFWESIKNSKNPDDFRNYLKKYPTRTHVDLARERQRALEEEEAAWEKIKNSKNVEDFRKFLDNYPKGEFAEQAMTRLEELKKEETKRAAEAASWGKIKSSKNPQVFIVYLTIYPDGEFAGLARSRFRELATIVVPMGMELGWIKQGSFRMGSGTVSSDEKPVHQVTIGDGFYMGKHEVTIAEWSKVMGDIPEGMKKDLDGKFKEDEKQPVVRVSWDDAQEFIRRLNARGGDYTYRLPTEAEWEYACRAGTTGDYAGDLDAMAWYSRNSRGQTHPVGTQQPNGFGLFDMHGNVVEWCGDWYHENYNGAPTDGSAWVGVGKQNNAVLRGGSWSKSAEELNSAYRRKSKLDYRSENIGFRVVAVVRK